LAHAAKSEKSQRFLPNSRAGDTLVLQVLAALILGREKPAALLALQELAEFEVPSLRRSNKLMELLFEARRYQIAAAFLWLGDNAEKLKDPRSLEPKLETLYACGDDLSANGWFEMPSCSACLPRAFDAISMRFQWVSNAISMAFQWKFNEVIGRPLLPRFLRSSARDSMASMAFNTRPSWPRPGARMSAERGSLELIESVARMNLVYARSR